MTTANPSLALFLPRPQVAPPRPALIYDPECELCARSIHRLQALDWLHALDVHTAQEALRRYPFAFEGKIQPGLRVVFSDGTVQGGIDALREALMLTPIGSLIAWSLWIEPVHDMAEKSYADLIHHRGSSGCALGH